MNTTTEGNPRGRIYESATTMVERGRWNDRDVVIKTLKSSSYKANAIARYHHEYVINQSLTSAYVCRALTLIETDHQIVFEDCGATSLRDLIRQGTLALEAKLDVATSLCHAVQSIHDEGVIHRDLNPANIIYAAAAGTLKLIDFGLATLSPRAYPETVQVTHLTGTLPYISPEQTGRVNRVVDYRTDLYSLGATLYELFSGSPPFTNTDPLELIHYHIARTPAPLDEVNPNLPRWLSEIVLKLLAKQPEDRYQSGAAAGHDLEEASELWHGGGDVDTFLLGRSDTRGQLALPKRLYGREHQSAALDNATDRAFRGELAMVHVHAPMGMGKSAFVDWIAGRFSDRHGLIARLTPSPDPEGDPLAPVTSIVRSLVRLTLSARAELTRDLFTRLRGLHEREDEDLLRVVPELGAVIGTAESGVELDASSRRRVLKRVLESFAPLPVAVIVDDADRLDPDAIDEIFAAVRDARSTLLLLTSETANEPELPADLAGAASHLTLTELSAADVRTLLSDLLSQRESKVRELAAIVHDKTDGVPRHVLDLLFELHADESLYHDTVHNGWSWDLARVRQHYFTDNTRARIERQLDALGAATLAAMETGACLGDRFSLGDFPMDDEDAAPQIAAALRPAVTAGLLARVTDDADQTHRYQFAHPRVRALTYARIAEADKAGRHRRIADALMRRRKNEPGRVLAVADHLNAAAHPLEDSVAERNRTAHYDLLAARHALTEARFQPAFKYCRSALLVIRDDRDDVGLRDELVLTAAEAAYLCGDFEQLESLLGRTEIEPREIEDRIALHAVRIRASLARNNLGRAIQTGFACLEALRHVPERPSWLRTFTDRRLPKTRTPLTDPVLKQTFRIICYLVHAGYHAGDQVAGRLGADVISRSQRAGFATETAFAYAAEACLAIDAGYVRRGQTLANNARLLISELPEDEFTVRTRALLLGLFDPWCANLDATLAPLLACARDSARYHDYEFALTATAFFATNGVLRGMELTSLDRELKDQLDALAVFRHVTAVNIGRFIQQVIQSLLGHADREGDEEDEPRVVDNPEDKAAFAYVYVLRVYFAVLFNDFNGAANILEQAQRYARVLVGSPLKVLLVFLRALISLHRDPSRARTEIRDAQRSLARYLRHGCTFAEPKLYILKAEQAWLAGQTTAALEAYEKAAASARRMALANDEALAYELAARRCDERSRSDFAKLFVRNAYQAYLRWGALAKASHLEREFQGLIGDKPLSRPESGTWTVTDLADLTLRDFASQSGSFESHEFGERLVDTTTVLRAAQTISGEIVLDRVLGKLLRLALEHAGAQKACMLLKADGTLYVEAVASVDSGSVKRVSPAAALNDSDDVPQSVVQFVARTRKALVLSDATREDVFTQDPYVKHAQPLSVLCLPILSRGEVTGVLYVEHRWLSGVFTAQRVEVLSLLASQAAISIENARLYGDLQSTRDEYRTLYESANEGLFRITLDGQLMRANPRLATILGFDTVPTLLEDYRDLLDRIFLRTDRASEFMTELDSRGMVSAFEAEGVARDGKSFWMSVAARINHEPERGEFIDGSVVDISARIERERAEQQRQIAEAATKAKSEFLANMSHEIRTPMNAIVGFSKLTLETELDHKQREYLSSIRNAAESLLSLVNDVLDFSKIEAGKLTLEQAPFHLPDTLDQIERLFRTETRKKRLALDIDDRTAEHDGFPTDAVLIGDSLRLRQVLINLISNAVKFTEEGGISVEVSVSAARDDAMTLVFNVHDTGIGIDGEHQERLFESFEQAETSTTRRYGGTGLGLTICKRLVTMMGGDISFTSRPGEGSCFSFSAAFGLAQGGMAPTARELPMRARSPEILYQKEILLAEDNPINQQLALEFLTRAHAQVDIAENGRQALARLEEKAYDVVLMDIHMPVMDGLEATREIRERGFEVPIIAVSADALEERRSTALDAGCNDYITKPIDFDALLATLAQHLAADGERPAPRRRATDVMEDVLDGQDEAPELALRLQRIPGIDIAAAIKNHNDNVKLMLKLMGDFGRYYGDAGQRMRTAIKRGTLEDAERLAHNLHGVAGSFGAEHLKNAAKALELALAGGVDRDGLMGLLVSFEIALGEVQESAESLASKEVPFRASDLS